MPLGRPISFLATNNPQKTKAFYCDIVNLIHLKDTHGALVFRDGDSLLHVQIVADFAATKHTVHGWQTDNLARDMGNLSAKGVTFLKVDGLDQDPDGVWISPERTQVAWFHDPSGNVLSLAQLPTF